eukprot:TRINITY_DN4503_c0_g1_i2.p1 TRINITY_DN4503_c0_g1~~TRINITY_DN4503_c0_g1_i2.p1  ORF type:complete len:130 (-),score=7.93 TRINITY_DN4503_c0_g1_i2:60-449(-)
MKENTGRDSIDIVSLKKDFNLGYTVICVVLWFLCSLINNASAKAILVEVPHPITFAIFQMSAMLVYSIITFKLNGKEFQPLTFNIIGGLVFLGVIQVCSKLLHQVALIYAPVSFVHTIKVVIAIINFVC